MKDMSITLRCHFTHLWADISSLLASLWSCWKTFLSYVLQKYPYLLTKELDYYKIMYYKSNVGVCSCCVPLHSPLHSFLSMFVPKSEAPGPTKATGMSCSAPLLPALLSGSGLLSFPRQHFLLILSRFLLVPGLFVFLPMCLCLFIFISWFFSSFFVCFGSVETFIYQFNDEYEHVYKAVDVPLQMLDRFCYIWRYKRSSSFEDFVIV